MSVLTKVSLGVEQEESIKIVLIEVAIKKGEKTSIEMLSK